MSKRTYWFVYQDKGLGKQRRHCGTS
jgi:hypothetical protein